ncbi:MAG: hypothetical protein WC511_03725 [Candidatus Pacearchaeota archaeon]
MLKDSNGNELSKTDSYQIGEGESDYFFQKYVPENKALFSTQKQLTNGEPCERVLSQNDIDTLKVYPVLDLKDKNLGLESSVLQSSPKCTIERS